MIGLYELVSLVCGVVFITTLKLEWYQEFLLVFVWGSIWGKLV